MFELMNQFHNSIDGSFCWGILQYEGLAYGSQGQICIYRCSQCGLEIHNLEDDFAGNDEFEGGTGYEF
ncbi:MAG: hypothetical protein J6Y13_04865 [Treponema sp.]|nr:hypothetical protein [Treponema sp.]